jgi:hypothetical protein
MNTDKLKYMKCKQPLSDPSHVLLPDPIQCKASFTGKATRAPHTPRSKAPLALNLINLDTVGPFPTSRRGNRFCCIIFDDASGCPAAVVAKTKGAVAPLVINKLRQLRHQLRRQVDVTHKDSALELCKGLIQQWVDQQGTVTTISVPNHSASNGLAERTNRTIQESATAALGPANMTHE